VLFLEALTAAISTTPVSHFVGSVHAAHHRQFSSSVHHPASGFCPKNPDRLCLAPYLVFGGHPAPYMIAIDKHLPGVIPSRNYNEQKMVRLFRLLFCSVCWPEILSGISFAPHQGELAPPPPSARPGPQRPDSVLGSSKAVTARLPVMRARRFIVRYSVLLALVNRSRRLIRRIGHRACVSDESFYFRAAQRIPVRRHQRRTI